MVNMRQMMMEQREDAEERVRLAFGSIATTISSQWYSLEKHNDMHTGLMQSDGSVRVLAFEAKGRLQKPKRIVKAPQQPEPASTATTWSGAVQVYDQSTDEIVELPQQDSVSWDWHAFTERNLVEIDEFRPHMTLHNYYEGLLASDDGLISATTWDAIEERLRTTLEDCDHLRSIECLVDMDSSWGGLAQQVLMYMAEECPRAVRTTIANDGTYPLAEQEQDYLYAMDAAARDQSKVHARRHLNLAAATAQLSELSSVFVPISIDSSAGLQRFSPQGRRDRATIAAMAIDVAMNAYKQTSIYGIQDGIVPSRKLLELSAQFPFHDDAVRLLDQVCTQETIQLLVDYSFLPQSAVRQKSVVAASFVQHAPALVDDDEEEDRSIDVVSQKNLHRVLHCQGHFASHPPSSMVLSRVNQLQHCVVQWTPASVRLPHADATLVRSLTDEMDAVSQLSQSSTMASYVNATAQSLRSVDKRVLYEFARVGIGSDAIEELYTTLTSTRDAYLES